MEGLTRAGFRFGDSVLVQGSGTVGLLAIAAAVASGADRVVAIGGPRKRLDLAFSSVPRKLWTSASCANPQPEKGAVLGASLGGHGFGIVVECAFGHLLEPGAALSLGINLAWRRP